MNNAPISRGWLISHYHKCDRKYKPGNWKNMKNKIDNFQHIILLQV